ncbi:MAG: DUF4350 domain-containing protein [Deltaproteobacteria bacterium]|nr:DUF4350 domain-containing protein [Deltaproteobacteria bacterium]
MTRRVPARRFGALAVAAAMVALASPGLAAFEVEDTGWEGLSGFVELARSELGADRVIASKALDWRQLTPTDSLLLVHPTALVDPDEAAAFMRVGGRVAVLDDHGNGDRLLKSFKVERRPLPEVPERFVRQNHALAVASPVAEANGGVHPTVVDVPAVVLNHGTGFAHPELTTVLEVRGADGGASSPVTSVPVAIAGQVERGRLFAVGDPSAFMNLMLRFPGNQAFATGVVRYLTEGEGGARRGGRLIVLVNDFEELNSFAGEAPLRKNLERSLHTLTAGLEDLRDHGFPWWLHTLVAATCGLVLLTWSLRASMRLYAPRLPRFARTVPLAAQGGVAGRLAVLASPGAAPELAMLELRTSLVESLSLSLGEPETTSLGMLLEAAARRRAIDGKLLARGLEADKLMRRAEATLVDGRRSTTSRRDVTGAAEVVGAILDALAARPPPP